MTDPIAALQARYRASFPDKRAELLAALMQWRDRPEDEDALRPLAMMTHKLAGSAGSYGFDAIGALAREADHLITAHARDGAAMSPVRVAPIDAAVVALAEALVA